VWPLATPQQEQTFWLKPKIKQKAYGANKKAYSLFLF
jgi:hypothetical protein